MGVEGVAKCMKYVLVIFNTIFVILGATCLGIGIWILVDKEKLMELAKISSDSGFDVPSLLQQGAYVLLGGGAFMFLIGIFGCVGACKESRVLLTVYGILVLLVFTLELVAGILAAVYRGKIESELKAYLKSAINTKYYGTWSTSSAFSLALDYVQLQYDCCGVDSHSDFYTATNWNKVSPEVPVTCCKFSDKSAYPDKPDDLRPDDPTCPATGTATNAWLNKGCYNTVRDLLEENAKIIIGVGVGVALIELMGVIFAFYVCCKLREQNKIY